MQNEGSGTDLRRRTKQLAIDVIRLCRALPHDDAGRTISRQLIRSGTSVGANYRAVCRARSRPDFVAKLGVVLEEADETAFWLELLCESGVSTSEQIAPLLREVNELIAIFVSSLRTAKGLG